MGVLSFLVEPFVAAITPYLERIMSAQTDAADKLKGLKTQLTKVSEELTAKIQALTDAANNNSGSIDPALQTAIDDLQPIVDALDAIVPDAPPAQG